MLNSFHRLGISLLEASDDRVVLLQISFSNISSVLNALPLDPLHESETRSFLGLHCLRVRSGSKHHVTCVGAERRLAIPGGIKKLRVR